MNDWVYEGSPLVRIEAPLKHIPLAASDAEGLIATVEIDGSVVSHCADPLARLDRMIDDNDPRVYSGWGIFVLLRYYFQAYGEGRPS